MRAHFKKGRLPANARWGGASPARDQSSMRKFRVICRGGIYAARRSQPGNATQRANRTGRIYASPTNLLEKPYAKNTLPCRDGH